MGSRATPRPHQPIRIESDLRLTPTVAKWEVDLMARLLGKVLRETADGKEASRDPRS